MTTRSAGKTVLRLYAAMLALIGVIALALAAFASAADPRGLMPLSFAHLDRSLATAGAIALTNARVALIPLALATVAHRGGAVRLLADLVVAGLLALNSAELAAALAGYGLRAAVALTPHAFVELAAFAVAGVQYRTGRRRPSTRRELARSAGACALLLLFAAGLEIYVQLRIR